ncbi:hypothetical protein D7V97_38435 [Corallococcus sp. CA053C]|uniref:hypothetical protein n=1 Tax=Corallococcus sp. CA053C TaxID=2316732 RepID=UPI000EA383A0|nr:hypothetical protein [Corallococcus sp. CA053C]RKG94692.1 hypothetical protein D7V97_38435 [Corallococcus sp. CA053C]
MGTRPWRLLPLLLLNACALFRPPVRPVHAPPEQAERFAFPIVLPEEGQQVLSGTMAASVALAMEDFLPLGSKPPGNASPAEVCVNKREAYDVTGVPGKDGVVFVRFSISPMACRDLAGPAISDVPTVYAVDTRQWVILSIQK